MSKHPPLIKTESIEVTPLKLPRYTEHREALDQGKLEKLKTHTSEQINWAGSILDIPRVWGITKGEGVKVAVLDTGIDIDHPDLKSAIKDSVDLTGDGIEDTNGHGTHCAGIIGARLNNIGFVGVAPKSELLIAKVLNNNGQGANSWVTKGIYWAVENGADIISMSLGGPTSDPDLYKAIQYALYHGVFIICAAGNEGGLGQNTIGYPARYGGVITVASHDINGNPSGFSSQGGEVDVMAPGSRIWSTYINGGYKELSGTSMATPFVAGLAALITAKHKLTHGNKTPLQNNEDLKNHLLIMATHPGYHDNQSGYGPLIPFRYFY
ncbi:S8 family peptidase [Photobacterium satsumensis]|uniref:S8 family peptidase n=1 Tax=Photobacterium satsumensis TaxID=2910239 RepID=UPI003D13A554